MEHFVLSVFLFIAGATLISAAGVEFSYDANAPDGPAHWGYDCNKTRQSPINIVTNDTVYENFGDFNFVNFDQTLANVSFEAVNNGHSYQFNLPWYKYNVSGGGLPGTFTAIQFHLHWGSDNSQGSEHQVDGIKFPAEMHIVNMNTKYPNTSVAVMHEDGLAVLGVILQVGAENAAFNAALQYTANLTLPGTNVPGIPAFRLDHLLPTNTTKYFRYNGSLTTPKCNQAVIWTNFNHTVKISQAQLEKLRSLKFNATEMMVDNFRPVQALNGRKVKASFQAPDPMQTTPQTPTPQTPTTHDDDHGASSSFHVTTGLFVSMLIAAYFLN